MIFFLCFSYSCPGRQFREIKATPSARRTPWGYYQEWVFVKVAAEPLGVINGQPGPIQGQYS